MKVTQSCAIKLPNVLNSTAADHGDATLRPRAALQVASSHTRLMLRLGLGFGPGCRRSFDVRAALAAAAGCASDTQWPDARDSE